MPNPTLVSGTQNNAGIGSGTSVTVTSTGSVTAGNLQIVALLVGGATAPSALAPPAGWTTSLSTQATSSGGTVVCAIFTKIATVTGAFSGSFTWTTTATSGDWAFTEWSGTQGLDGAINATQNILTVKTSPSATPGTGNVNDTLVCCNFGGAVGADALTIPAGMTAISSMATAGTASTPFFYGAYLFLASASATGTKTWTIPTSLTNLGISLLIQQGPVWGFSGANYDESSIPIPQPKVIKRAGGVKSKSEFGFYTPWSYMGWEAQPPPPPHYRPERYAAIMPHEDGMEAPERPAPKGWDPILYQPNHPRPERLAAIAPREDGNESTYANWINDGWEIQPALPPHPRPEKFGAMVLGDVGTEAKFIAALNITPWGQVLNDHQRQPRFTMSALKGRSDHSFYPPWSYMGWEIQPPQPNHPRPERAAAIILEESGTEAPISVPPVLGFPLGWEEVFSQPHIFPNVNQRSAALIDEPIIVPFHLSPWWETTISPSDRFPRIRYSFTGDTGTEAPFYFPKWAFDPLTFVSRRIPRQTLHQEDGIESPLKQFFPDGWEFQPSQPPHPRPERFGAIVPEETGTEAVFVPTVAQFAWGWEFTQANPRIFPSLNQRGIGAAGRSNFAAFSLLPWWETTVSPSDRFPRIRYSFEGDQGNQALFNLAPAPPIVGWEGVYPTPNYLRHLQSVRIEEGNEFPQINFFNFGWSTLQPQPNHPRPERSAAIIIEESGNEGKFVIPLLKTPFGYDVQQTFIGWNYRRSGAIETFPFIESKFANWFYMGWEIAPPPPPHPRPEKWASIAPFPNIEAKLIQFYPYGWEVQPPPPPHPRPERFGSIVLGDTGTEAKFVPPAATSPWWGEFYERPTRVRYTMSALKGRSDHTFYPPWSYMGWEIQPPQPPHPAPERRFAGISQRDEVSLVPSVVVVRYDGWEPVLYQPNHPRTERAGANMIGVDGQNIFYNFYPYGWPVQPWQPPHPRPERFGATAPRDEGIEKPFIPPIVFPDGWAIQPFQPGHPRPERFGAIAPDDKGIYFPFIFVPPPPPPIPRLAIKNIFAVELFQHVRTTDAFIPPHQQTYPVKVYVNEPAHLMLRLESHYNIVPITILITRPDGTQYYTGFPYTYVSVLHHGTFLDYTSAIGEFNQMGWWIAQYYEGNEISNQFAFYITPIGGLIGSTFFPTTDLA